MATKTSRVRWVSTAALAVVALMSVSAAAAPPPVPATLTQQGRILDSSGAPVSSKVAVTFTLYNDAKASAKANTLWTETQNITLDDGYFSAQLGDVKALPVAAFDGSVLYLGIQVGSDDEMTPRETLTSVPYALLAGQAASAASADSVSFTSITGIPAACGAGQYLKGFAADGTATCAQPTLSCHNNVGTAGTNSSAVACDSGVITGGGCQTTGTLTSFGYDPLHSCLLVTLDVTTLSTGAAIPIGPINNLHCPTYSCSGTGTVTATALCCAVQ